MRSVERRHVSRKKKLKNKEEKEEEYEINRKIERKKKKGYSCCRLCAPALVFSETRRSHAGSNTQTHRAEQSSPALYKKKGGV
jgi:hypothetical protein